MYFCCQCCQTTYVQQPMKLHRTWSGLFSQQTPSAGQRSSSLCAAGRQAGDPTRPLPPPSLPIQLSHLSVAAELSQQVMQPDSAMSCPGMTSTAGSATIMPRRWIIMGPRAHARQRTGSFTAAQASHMPPLMSVQAGGTTTVPEIQPSAAHKEGTQQSADQPTVSAACCSVCPP